MGDAIHVLPALSDLTHNYPDAEIDWMIEKSFAEIPGWHNSVKQVFPVSTRDWRKPRRQSLREFRHFLRTVRSTPYDVIIDAQGLMKSAVFARFARLATDGVRVGFSAESIKEKPAARLYQKKIHVARDLHAIERVRSLFGGAFGYEYSSNAIDYGIGGHRANEKSGPLVFLHGTTWPSKHLPEPQWQALIELAARDGYQVLLPWGNEVEKFRAERLSMNNPNAEVLPRSSLTELKHQLARSSGVIAVDTGLGHLAAALGVPSVSVYGSTNAGLTGALGDNQTHIQTDFTCSPCLLKNCDKITDGSQSPPCYANLQTDQIWDTLRSTLA
jgi:heptosyltransferase-1